jgi:hypothetical protein
MDLNLTYTESTIMNNLSSNNLPLIPIITSKTREAENLSGNLSIDNAQILGGEVPTPRKLGYFKINPLQLGDQYNNKIELNNQNHHHRIDASEEKTLFGKKRNGDSELLEEISNSTNANKQPKFFPKKPTSLFNSCNDLSQDTNKSEKFKFHFKDTKFKGTKLIFNVDLSQDTNKSEENTFNNQVLNVKNELNFPTGNGKWNSETILNTNIEPYSGRSKFPESMKYIFKDLPKVKFTQDIFNNDLQINHHIAVNYFMVGYDDYNIIFCDDINLFTYRFPRACIDAKPITLWNGGDKDPFSLEKVLFPKNAGGNIQSSYIRNEHIIEVFASFKFNINDYKVTINSPTALYADLNKNYQFYYNDTAITHEKIENNILYSVGNNKYMIPQSYHTSCTYACVNMLAKDHKMGLVKQEVNRRAANEIINDLRKLFESNKLSDIVKIDNSNNREDFWEKVQDFILRNGAVIGSMSERVNTNESSGGHVIMIDEIDKEFVIIREPLMGNYMKVKIEAIKPYLTYIIGVTYKS